MQFQGTFEARNALLNFIIDRTGPLPDDLRDKLREFLMLPSPTIAVGESVELIYARRDEVPPELAEIAAAAAAYCASVGFLELDKGERGGRIAKVLLQDARLATGEPIPDADAPEPAARFAPPVAEPE